MKVKFPDGTVVTALSMAERQEHNPDRDFGLYFDAAWRPTWEAHVIDWVDFGLPTDCVQAARMIVATFRRAKAGERVEIGCAGGLGRTGTVLACMAILAGVQASQAVQWVRRNYKSNAIESTSQEQWVAWFAKQVMTGRID